jgi:hypothetical protein
VILSFLFTGGVPPKCMDSGDSDDSGGRLNLTDAIVIFNWLFTGGPVPRMPSPNATTYAAAACGVDPSGDADGLDCAAPAGICQ